MHGNLRLRRRHRRPGRVVFHSGHLGTGTFLRQLRQQTNRASGQRIRIGRHRAVHRHGHFAQYLYDAIRTDRRRFARHAAGHSGEQRIRHRYRARRHEIPVWQELFRTFRQPPADRREPSPPVDGLLGFRDAESPAGRRRPDIAAGPHAHRVHGRGRRMGHVGQRTGLRARRLGQTHSHRRPGGSPTHFHLRLRLPDHGRHEISGTCGTGHQHSLRFRKLERETAFPRRCRVVGGRGTGLRLALP